MQPLPLPGSFSHLIDSARFNYSPFRGPPDRQFRGRDLHGSAWLVNFGLTGLEVDSNAPLPLPRSFLHLIDSAWFNPGANRLTCSAVVARSRADGCLQYAPK
jgi:hypothetical protein